MYASYIFKVLRRRLKIEFDLLISLNSSLEVGFVSISHEKCNYAVTNVEFDLYQFGENGKPPVDYAFNFYTGKNISIHNENINVCANAYYKIT